MNTSISSPMNTDLAQTPQMINDYILPIEDQSLSKMMKYINQSKQNDYAKDRYNLSLKLKEKEAENSSLYSTIKEKEDKIQRLKETLNEFKIQGLKMEKELNALKDRERNFEVKIQQEQLNNNYLKFQIEILEKQIQKLTSAVTACDSRISELLRKEHNLGIYVLFFFIKLNFLIKLQIKLLYSSLCLIFEILIYLI